MNWFLTQKKWAAEVGCPDGVYEDFNIDAKINSAYIIIGLLYGNGDFGKTIQISTLCGQDSDCNPASAAGILGVLMGYSGIPSEWKLGLKEVEDINFKYTDISLNDAYDYSYRQAIAVIDKNGGKVLEDEVKIKYQEVVPVKFEQGFGGHYPAEYKNINLRMTPDNPELAFEFEGNGFVVRGGCPWGSDPEYVGNIEVLIDGHLHEKASIPADFKVRRHDLTWAYELNPGKHQVNIKLLNPNPDIPIEANKIIIYTPTKEQRVRPGLEGV
jgi:hypothetical protein